MNTVTVRKLLVSVHNLLYIREFTHGRIPACCECRKVFSRIDQPVSHQRTHSGQKPCKCCTFEKTFDLKSQLILHQSIHTGEKPYEGIDCQKAFNTVLIHGTSENPHQGETYGCCECGRFSSESQLIVRQRAHSGVKPYGCNQCGKDFSLKSQLISHERVTGRKARGLQTEEIGWKCQTFLSLS